MSPQTETALINACQTLFGEDIFISKDFLWYLQPAGLKAASVAARRGHRVTLYEAGPRVGGQILLAERLPGRAEFGGFYTGSKYGGNVTFTYRKGETLSSSLLVDHNLVDHNRQRKQVQHLSRQSLHHQRQHLVTQLCIKL